MHNALDTSIPIMVVAIAAGAVAGLSMWRAAGWQAGLVIGLAALIPGLMARDWGVAIGMAAIAALAWWWRRSGVIGPRDTSGLSVQVLLVVFGYLLYEIGRVLIETDAGHAIDNAREVVAFERSLGIFHEREVQEHLSRGALGEAFNVYYRAGFHPIPVVALIWFYLRDRTGYLALRNAFAISATAGLLIIALFPVAPPRLVPGLGIVDTISAVADDRMLANRFAAIVSFHVGWPVLVAVLVAIRARGPWRFAMFVPAAAMALTVVVTGNHYWVDGMVGATISLIPAIATLLILEARERPAGCSQPPASRRAPKPDPS